MSDAPRDRRSDAQPARLDALVAEAREHLRPAGRGPRDDWSDVDVRLLARVRDDERAVAADERRRAAATYDEPRGARGVWLTVGGLAAAAAVALLVTHPRHGAAPDDASLLTGASGAATPGHAAQAGSLASRDGAGEIRVGGAVVEDGRAVAAGDTIETAASRGLFVTAAPGDPHDVRVAWAVEEHTRVALRRSEAPLVLALEHGAVEAQVRPVPSGEAFAVDVGNVRVAVHGTHLRVARAGDHVTVDLTEGVVSIGLAPRAGPTEGRLVVAPAHVELEARDLHDHESLLAALRIDHAPTAVRPAVRLSPATSVASNGPPNGVVPSLPGVAAHEEPAGSGPAEPEHEHEHDPSAAAAGAAAGHTGSASGGSAAAASGAAAGATTSNPARVVAAPATDAHPERVLAAAVKACAVDSLDAADVRVTVSTKLTLRIGEDGAVRLARFEPPLSPAAQECASRAIYKTRFPPSGAEGGRQIVIPIDVEKAR